MKKLSNCQEDKIKRLGTKLIRLAGSRSCGYALDIVDDRNKTAALELENTKVDCLQVTAILSYSCRDNGISQSEENDVIIYSIILFLYGIDIVKLFHDTKLMRAEDCDYKFNFKMNILK